LQKEDGMEDPSRSRVVRIAKHLLSALEDYERASVRDATAYKRAMVDIVQFLNIEEAYAVSTYSAKLYEWFQTEGVWRTLAQRWLSPVRYNQVWQWAERARHQGDHINYLWLLIAEYGSRFGGYLAVYPYHKARTLGLFFGRDGTLREVTQDFKHPFNQYMRAKKFDTTSEYGRFVMIYSVFVDFETAKASFEDDYNPAVLIRKPLSTN
jgi:hypothetical protein